MSVKNAKEIPLSTQRFHIGLLAVVTLVALRLALGCHFLYEGVWKITHRHEFKVEPFLTTAKGPIAPLFYAMMPDIDARERLHFATRDGKKVIDSKPVIGRWDDIRQQFVDYYRPASADEAGQKRLESQAQATFEDFSKKLKKYFSDNVNDIAAYFGALDRFESDKERYQQAPFQKQRRWDRMMELRREADQWVNEVEAQEQAFKNSLYSLLDAEQREWGTVPPSWNPLRWTRIEQLNFVVTYALTAIGLCLLLGFCTPLAALGGAGFMCFVVATQPAWPTLYPHDPAVVGHALLINKDFVELVALLVVAATAAGRWGGLDYFLYNFILRPLLSWKARKSQPR